MNNVGYAQRDDAQRSYEFTLNHVSQDKDGGDIWEGSSAAQRWTAMTEMAKSSVKMT